MNEIATIEKPAITPAAEAPLTGKKLAKKLKIKKSAFPRKAAYFILYVPDMAKAVDFYKNSIGLKLGFESPEWTEFKCGIKFALHAWSAEMCASACSSESAQAPAKASEKAYKPVNTSLCFGVKDAGRTYEAFKALGVKVKGEPHEVCEDGYSFAFEDPFGNTLSVYGKMSK